MRLGVPPMRLGVQGTPPNPPPKSDKASILHSLNKGCFAKYLESTQTWGLSMSQNFLENFLQRMRVSVLVTKKKTKHSSMNSHPLVRNSNFHPIPLLLFLHRLRRDQLRLLLLHILRVSGLLPALIPKHRRLRCTQPSVNSRPCWFLHVYWAGQCWQTSQRLLWIAGVTVR